MDHLFAFIDLEATSFDAQSAEIIEFAVLLFKNDRLISDYHTLIRPTQRIPEDVVQLTGISNRMCKNRTR